MQRTSQNNLVLLLWTLVLLGLSSCTHLPPAEKIQNLDRPLLELQKAAANTLPAGLKSVSENNREFFSHPFQFGGKAYELAKPGDSRYLQAHVIVLGDSRPYTVEIRVYQVVNNQRVGSDNKLEKRLKNEILADLAKRRENRNVIDTFRPF